MTPSSLVVGFQPSRPTGGPEQYHGTRPVDPRGANYHLPTPRTYSTYLLHLTYSPYSTQPTLRDPAYP